MNQAVALHQAGRLNEAEISYREILAWWPSFGDALHLHGVVLSQLGRHGDAIEQLNQAVRLQPGNPAWRHNLGKALHVSGRQVEAEREYCAVLASQPQFPEALFNLGNLLKDDGRMAEAAAYYRRLLQLEPEHWRALNNLGNTLVKLKRLEEAESALRSALALKPDYSDAHNNLGIVLAGRGELNAALVSYSRALELKPNFPQALLNRANVLLDLDLTDEAIVALQTAQSQEPGLPEVHNSLGNAFLAQGQVECALEHYDRALALAPNDASTHFNLALAYLLGGDFTRGWTEYEWGLQSRLREPQRDFQQNRWNGDRFDGKTLLVVGEQGIGDVFQFLRYLPLVAARGGKVIVEVQQGIGSLCARSFPEVSFVERAHDGHIAPAFDLHCHLMSLPFLLGHATESDIPDAIPYLMPDPARVRKWAERLVDFHGRRIGLVWAGNPEHKNDRRRSIPLALLLPLTQIAGTHLFSLQKGPGAGQITSLPERGIIDLSAELVSFEDTSAIVANLDLVVSVDTSIAHLAGALGKPTRVLLPFAPDWRWQRNRHETPWYPQACLLRQPEPGNWPQVVSALVEELSA